MVSPKTILSCVVALRLDSRLFLSPPTELSRRFLGVVSLLPELVDIPEEDCSGGWEDALSPTIVGQPELLDINVSDMVKTWQ